MDTSLAGPTEAPPRAHHDMGGVSRLMCERIDTSPHAPDAFDKEVDALSQLLRARGLMTVDEMRRGIEAIPAAEYDRLSYYQRWIRSMADTLMRRGVIEEAELARALGRP